LLRWTRPLILGGGFLEEHPLRRLEKVMHTLSINETQQVTGGASYVRTFNTVGLTTGGAALGGYLGAMRLGATLGAAGGPVGAVIGGLAGCTIAYFVFDSK
jgi:hypothetical protein